MEVLHTAEIAHITFSSLSVVEFFAKNFFHRGVHREEGATASSVVWDFCLISSIRRVVSGPASGEAGERNRRLDGLDEQTLSFFLYSLRKPQETEVRIEVLHTAAIASITLSFFSVVELSDRS